MPFISFIYRFGRNTKTYYGKYETEYVSYNHEGLNEEAKAYLIDGLNLYRKKKGLSKLKAKTLHLGVISFVEENHVPVYSSDAEIKCFDFYILKIDYKCSYYMNGQLIA